MNLNVHFSSENSLWETPQKFFDLLDEKFNFTLDPCCTLETAKCKKFYTKEDDGLSKSWAGEVVYMNPPYGDPEQVCKPKCIKKKCKKRGYCCTVYVPGIIDWMRKAYEESNNGATVVCLVPARTDTKWWHEFALKGEVEFIKGRLKFGGHKNSAPFPSAVVVFIGKKGKNES